MMLLLLLFMFGTESSEGLSGCCYRVRGHHWVKGRVCIGVTLVEGVGGHDRGEGGGSGMGWRVVGARVLVTGGVGRGVLVGGDGGGCGCCGGGGGGDSGMGSWRGVASRWGGVRVQAGRVTFGEVGHGRRVLRGGLGTAV